MCHLIGQYVHGMIWHVRIIDQPIRENSDKWQVEHYNETLGSHPKLI
jgi:hypothetical protein